MGRNPAICGQGVNEVHLRKLLSGLFAFAACLAISDAGSQAADISLRFGDLERQGEAAWVAAEVKLPPENRTLPIASDTKDSPVSALLRRLEKQGTASGFHEVLYDNRDRGHSLLPEKLFPRLHRVKYGPRLRSQNADRGLAGTIRYPTIVFGNSSMAVTRGPAERSLTRLAMTSSVKTANSEWLYRNNHIYVYPEHRDYDEVDRYPANWPYDVVSQGSSGSDQPFLHAIGATLAALPKDTKEDLRNRGLIAPTLQLILRSNLEHIKSQQDFYDGKAHRPVLKSTELNPTEMVEHAASLEPEKVPLVAKIEVTKESFKNSAGLAGLDERLFDTRFAVARIWRSFAGTSTMSVSASVIDNPYNKKINYIWRVLQGDPKKVIIEQSNGDDHTAKISIDWHDEFYLETQSSNEVLQRKTSRVDIGVFATTEDGPGAPALISIYFPKHQLRTYERTADGTLQLQSINYHAKRRNEYFDPILHWTAPWSDTARYDDSGALIGWRRVYFDGTERVLNVPSDMLPGTYQLTELEKWRTLKFTKQREPIAR